MKKPIIPLKDLIENIDAEAVILEGLDDCIIGVSSQNTLVYSYIQLVKHYMFEGLTKSKAIEYIAKNVEPLDEIGTGFVLMYEADYMF